MTRLLSGLLHENTIVLRTYRFRLSHSFYCPGLSVFQRKYPPLCVGESPLSLPPLGNARSYSINLRSLLLKVRLFRSRFSFSPQVNGPPLIACRSLALLGFARGNRFHVRPPHRGFPDKGPRFPLGDPELVLSPFLFSQYLGSFDCHERFERSGHLLAGLLPYLFLTFLPHLLRRGHSFRWANLYETVSCPFTTSFYTSSYFLFFPLSLLFLISPPGFLMILRQHADDPTPQPHPRFFE